MVAKLIIDARELKRETDRIAREFDKRVALETIGQRFLKWVNDNFRSHGRGGLGYRGPGWAPLSPNTLAARPGAQPLRDTGQMASSFIPDVGNNSVTVGSNDKKALWHHEGTNPYTIRPVNAGMLAFTTTNGMTYARLVHHPGLPARPLVPDQSLGTQIALDTMEKLMDKVFKGRQ